MKIYFLRHGKADWPNWKKPDDDRPLTKEGKAEARKVARLLAKLKIAPSIFTSPLPRARETAEITGEILGAKVQEDETLRPGFDAKKLAALIRECSANELMVVGHEPDFSRAIKELTGGEVKLKKNAVALVELDSSNAEGELQWLLPPKFARL